MRINRRYEFKNFLNLLWIQNINIMYYKNSDKTFFIKRQNYIPVCKFIKGTVYVNTCNRKHSSELAYYLKSNLDDSFNWFIAARVTINKRLLKNLEAIDIVLIRPNNEHFSLHFKQSANFRIFECFPSFFFLWKLTFAH